MMLRLVAGVAALSLAPIPALAQPSYGSEEAQIHGRIVSFDQPYDLRVRDDRGYVDRIELHQGTIINPTGLTLTPGMTVTVLGVNTGSTLAANEIDTPYNYDGPQVADYPAYDYGPDYGYAGYGYGYGAYPYGYGFGFGPSFGLSVGFFGGFGFGGGYYGRGYYGRGFYGGGYGWHGGYGGYGGYGYHRGYGYGYHGGYGYRGGYGYGGYAHGGFYGAHGYAGGGRVAPLGGARAGGGFHGGGGGFHGGGGGFHGSGGRGR